MDGCGVISANIYINTEYPDSPLIEENSCLKDRVYRFFRLTCLISSFSAGTSLQRTIHVTFANFGPDLKASRRVEFVSTENLLND